MNIKEIVRTYNKNNEHKISDDTLKYAEILEKMFLGNNIDGYDIALTNNGDISFEWDSKNTLFSISINTNTATFF